MQGRVGGFRQAAVVGWGEEGAGQGFAFLIRFLVWEGCERNGERKFVPFRICVVKRCFWGELGGVFVSCQAFKER